MDDLVTIALRIGAATVAGATIGFNRDLRGKPTGVRTFALVAIASAALTLAGEDLMDKGPSRVVQGIVGGIGFLGAGVILRDRQHVHNLTTAASVWVTAALGVLCGAGTWKLLAVTLTAVLAILLVGARIDRRLQTAADSHVAGDDGGSEGARPSERR